MAILHNTDLVPSKLELLAEWLPLQPWASGAVDLPLTRSGAFRLDDPDGEVGLETLIVSTANGRVFHVPVTYRGVPMEDGREALIGTPQHGVLGKRWVYDACADPVYVRTLLMTILNGGRQADIYYQTADGLEKREPTSYAWGTGARDAQVPGLAGPVRKSEGGKTLIEHGDQCLVLLRELDLTGPEVPLGGLSLLALWPGREMPVVLAQVVEELPATP
jgi:hypothetical protein